MRTNRVPPLPRAKAHASAIFSALGQVRANLRLGGSSKAGPVITDQGNFILDATGFDEGEAWLDLLDLTQNDELIVRVSCDQSCCAALAY